MQTEMFNRAALHPVKTGWVPPVTFPDLSGARVISFDVETCDPGLNARGPGCPRDEGFIAGIAVGTDDGFRGYFPMRHQAGGNLDPASVLRWASRELGRPEQTKVGAHLIYDLEWLAHEGVEVRGRLVDVGLAEPLLDEHAASYALGSIARGWLGEGKVDDGVYEWLADVFGGAPTRKAQAGNIWRAPSTLIGPYAEGDVDLPLRVWEAQRPALEAQGLMDVFRIECSLLPMLLAMRRRGVRVDVVRAERLRAFLSDEMKRVEACIRSLVGYPVNPRAPESFSRFFDAEGVAYPRTAKTRKPSITADWLERCGHPVGHLIREWRRLDKYRGVFVESYVLDKHAGGRVHAQFPQLRGDAEGTVSGRFSSKNPNMENIPDRDATPVLFDGREWPIGKLVRSLFLPDEGEEWCSDDYSQIEYRLIVHYGRGESAERARAAYRDDPSTSFHKMVMAMLGWGPERYKAAKNINFGKSYGMGVATAARNIGCGVEEARAFMDEYDERLPFVAELLREAARVAEERGWVRTLLGRRSRFTLWEPRNTDGWDKRPLPEDEARAAWGAIKRHRTYKALNSVIQGSAADVFKKGLADAWEAGCLAPAALGAPLNLVHDEVDTSRRRGREAEEAHREMVRCMVNAVELSVPLLVDSESGPNWGEAK